jgi:hypothetical protein
MTNHDVELIARNDAALLHEDSKKYVDANLFQYYTLIGSWCLLVKPHTSIGAAMLEDVIQYHGLLSTIKAASELSNALVSGELENSSTPGSIETALISVISGLEMSDALQILRYPKRFTVTACDTLAADTVKRFLDTNNRMGLLNRKPERPLDDFTMNLIVDEFNVIIDGYRSDMSIPRLSNGVSARFASVKTDRDWVWHYESKASLKAVAEKLGDWHLPNYYDSALYPNLNSAVMDGRSYLSSKRLAKLGTVPKSYKAYRTIAVETVNTQSMQQAVRAGLEYALSKMPLAAPIYNQAVNGIGASDPAYSTIDMTAASDSVSMWLLGQICCHPRANESARRLWFDVNRSRSFYVLNGQKHYILHMVATMGNGFCFALETAVFLAIARAATGLVARMRPDSGEYECTAYGDDLRVPNWAFAATIELLELCGFVVNHEKSFSDDEPFRESCGFDWYDGDFVSSTYWPRKVVSRSIESAPYLAALEGRLFERGHGLFYRECTNFLAKQTKLLAPTVSQVPLDVYLEYNLNGRCLVGMVGERCVVNYHRDIPWRSWSGVKRPYDEQRLYANVLTPSYRITAAKPCLEEYLYATFLQQGPRFDDYGVSESYHDPRDYRIPDSVIVTKQRLI